MSKKNKITFYVYESSAIFHARWYSHNAKYMIEKFPGDKKPYKLTISGNYKEQKSFKTLNEAKRYVNK